MRSGLVALAFEVTADEVALDATDPHQEGIVENLDVAVDRVVANGKPDAGIGVVGLELEISADRRVDDAAVLRADHVLKLDIADDFAVPDPHPQGARLFGLHGAFDEGPFDNLEVAAGQDFDITADGHAVELAGLAIAVDDDHVTVEVCDHIGRALDIVRGSGRDAGQNESQGKTGQNEKFFHYVLLQSAGFSVREVRPVIDLDHDAEPLSSLSPCHTESVFEMRRSNFGKLWPALLVGLARSTVRSLWWVEIGRVSTMQDPRRAGTESAWRPTGTADRWETSSVRPCCEWTLAVLAAYPFCMNALRDTILLSLLLMLTLPATSRSEDDDPISFVYPREEDHQLLVARRTRNVRLCDRLLTRVETYRVFGDGRLEIDPVPRWLRDEKKIVLGPEILEHLLHSVDALLDLGAHHLAEPEEEADSFVEVHLDRYVSPEHAIYYLDATAVSEIEAVFEELTTLKVWLIHRAAHRSDRPIWVSGNPWPRACQEEYRLKLGHRVLEPAWCSKPAFSGSVAYQDPFDGDDEAREAVRERLRERLRALPRSFSDSSSAGSSPSSDCGFGHSHSIELTLTKEDS